MFCAMERSQTGNDPQPLAKLFSDALQRYDDLASGKKTPAIATGIRPLDRLLNGGTRPGKLVGIAARPSVGKSAVARHIAIAAARSGVTTLLLSQEMPQDEVADCLIANLADIDGTRLQAGEISDAEWRRMADAVEESQNYKLWIDQQGGLTLSNIRAKARNIKGVGMILLDYLQLSQSTLKGASTNDQVAEISKGLKALAMELGIPVIVLSQLNREVEKRLDKEPQLADLRDSGAIEQDLDICIMLWTVKELSDDARLVGWKLAKHRGGHAAAWEIPDDAGNDWHVQISSEIKKDIIAKVTKQVVRRWVKIGSRPNHLWDCETMQICAALIKGVIAASVADEQKPEAAKA